jgi:hypothetical protein
MTTQLIPTQQNLNPICQAGPLQIIDISVPLEVLTDVVPSDKIFELPSFAGEGQQLYQ